MFNVWLAPITIFPSYFVLWAKYFNKLVLILWAVFTRPIERFNMAPIVIIR